MPARIITGWFGAFGGAVVRWFEDLGRFSVFSAYAASFLLLEMSARRGWARFAAQCFHVGTLSVPVVMVTGLFVGMVLAVQAYRQFEGAGLADHLGSVVNMSVVTELGPVLAGVMLAGRVGGALTAELGTMSVTEQLLALRSMGADPIRYLVTPRFFACLLLTPLLTVYADLMGAVGSWLITVKIYGQDSGPYWQATAQFVELWDVGSGMFKSMFFGGSIGLISCYKGFHCERGAEGVGRACTSAFVTSFIVILMLDLFLNIIINGLYQSWYGFKQVF